MILEGDPENETACPGCGDRILEGLSACPWCGWSAAREGLPEVVCLCGSTKFKEEFLEAQESLTLEGRIFLTVGFFGHVDGWPDDAGHESETKEDLDALHKRKIDLADRVHVINPGGYVGSSTRTEIAHARATGTPVTWLERPPGANAGGCWICETGNGHDDAGMPLDTEFDTYYHPECLEAAGCETITEFETGFEPIHHVERDL